MIGARRMAFPRIEALTFWLLMAAGAILTTTIFFGGFPTGWTGYAAAQRPGEPGMDSYIVFFALVGLSMTLLGLNMIATIVTMRAPGLTWSRLPIFVLGRALDGRADGARRAGARSPCSRWRCSTARRRRRFFIPSGRRQPVPVREPLLGLRPPGGVHPRPARLRDRARAAAGVLRASRSGATGSRSPGCSA